MLKVSEIFFSIQGEGYVIGLPSNFIRLSGCNLRCKWCDTKYAWEEYTEMTEKEIVRQLNWRIKRVTITGGEPLLQNLGALVAMLDRLGYNIIIETNGTIFPSRQLLRYDITWSVSPKLSNSGRQTELVCPVHLASYLKFVICDPQQDIPEMLSYCVKYMIPHRKVIVQPDGTRSDYVKALRELFEFVRDNNIKVRVLPQLHRLCYGLKRGV